MDTEGLSSNWKKLQQTLKSQAPPAKSNAASRQLNKQLQHGSGKRVKRKADSLGPASTNGNLKKRKSAPPPSEKQLQKQGIRANPKSKMGGYLSTSAAPAPSSREADVDLDEQDGNKEPKTRKQAATAGKFIAIDCEMVGTTDTTIFSVKSFNGNDFSILARVSVVSYAQQVIYDTYVLPASGVQVTDYRTRHSGITAWHLNKDNETTKPRPFEQVQEEVAELLQGRILVGHAISNDLAVLGLSHPKRSIRDTSSYSKYRTLAAATRRDGTPGKGRKPALKMLTSSVLGYEIQNNDSRGHDSVEDAKATMALFQREKKGFEEEAVKKFGRAALSASAVPRQGKTVGKPAPEDVGSANAQEDDDADEIEEDEDEDEDEEADAAEVENAEDMSVGVKVTAKGAKTKKRKKKKGKYRK